MERRNVGYAIAYILVFIFFAITGICFSVFKDKKQQVSVQAISVVCENGITIKSGSKSGQTISLEVHSPKVGTKPASGELDTQTDIPYTVTSQVGSEGAYATFSVESNFAYKIILASASGVPESEKDNVKISLVGSEKKSFSLKDTGNAIYNGEKDKKFTLLVWLDKHTTQKIVGSKINIELSVVAA